MKVCKFEKMKDENDIKQIVSSIRKEQPYVIVIPALTYLQEQLQQISVSWFHNENETSHAIINEIANYCCRLTDNLIKNSKQREEAQTEIHCHINNLHRWAEDQADLLIDKTIKAEGYRLSCNLFIHCLREEGINAKMLDTEEFMQLKMERTLDIPYVRESIQSYRAANQDVDLFVAPLSLCSNVYGETDFMSEKRNDYYATALAAIFQASEIVLWTKIETIYTNRNSLRHQHSLTYEEAEILVNSGVHLLYADCITLAKRSHLVIRVMDADHGETERLYISSEDTPNKIKAILAQDAVTFIRFKSLDTLPGYLLMSKVIDVIEKYKLHVVSMASSNVTISMVLVASRDSLWIIQKELFKYAEMTIDENMSVIHIIGSLQWEQHPMESSMIDTIKDIPVSLMSYGSSDHCLTLAVHTTDKNKLIQSLTNSYFSEPPLDIPFIITQLSLI